MKETCKGLKKWGMEQYVHGEPMWENIVKHFLDLNKGVLARESRKILDRGPVVLPDDMKEGLCDDSKPFNYNKCEDRGSGSMKGKNLATVQMAKCYVQPISREQLKRPNGKDSGIYGSGNGKPGDVGVNDTMYCNHCKQPYSTLLTCSRCKKTRYCSKECQKRAWPKHKASCDKK